MCLQTVTSEQVYMYLGSIKNGRNYEGKSATTNY